MATTIHRYINTDVGIARYNDKDGRYLIHYKGYQKSLHKVVFDKHYGKKNRKGLEIHHKDGNNSNNELSNLEIICPNCHSLTENFRGANMSKKIERSIGND
jgi:predicted HNH restriction endonuclease